MDRGKKKNESQAALSQYSFLPCPLRQPRDLANAAREILSETCNPISPLRCSLGRYLMLLMVRYAGSLGHANDASRPRHPGLCLHPNASTYMQ
jgi:hypothetical protein